MLQTHATHFRAMGLLGLRFLFLRLLDLDTSEHHCDLTLYLLLLCGLAAGPQFLFRCGPDAFSVSCLSGDQPSFLKQLGHQFSHKPLSYAIVPVLITETADLKLFSDRPYGKPC